MLSGSHRVMSMLSGSQCSLKRLKWQLSLRRLVQFKVAKVGWPCDSKLHICLLWSVSLGRPRPSFFSFPTLHAPRNWGGMLCDTSWPKSFEAGLSVLLRWHSAASACELSQKMTTESFG